MIAQGIKSPHRSVRNAALYAIGQFSEYLMPEIGEYAGEVLPVLFHFVDAAMAELKNPIINPNLALLTQIFRRFGGVLLSRLACAFCGRCGGRN